MRSSTSYQQQAGKDGGAVTFASSSRSRWSSPRPSPHAGRAPPSPLLLHLIPFPFSSSQTTPSRTLSALPCPPRPAPPRRQSAALDRLRPPGRPVRLACRLWQNRGRRALPSAYASPRRPPWFTAINCARINILRPISQIRMPAKLPLLQILSRESPGFGYVFGLTPLHLVKVATVKRGKMDLGGFSS